MSALDRRRCRRVGGGRIKRRRTTRLVGTATRFGASRPVYTNIQTPQKERVIFLPEGDPARDPSVPFGSKIQVNYRGKPVEAIKKARTVRGSKVPVAEFHVAGGI